MNDDIGAALFDLERRGSPLILSIPHAGLQIPRAISERLTPPGRELVDTDWHVPRLYPFAVDLDATTLTAHVSRYVVDLNRDPTGASLYPGAHTTALCPTQTFEGEPLYSDGDEPGEQEIVERRKRYWEPYHRALRAELDRVRDAHGYALLVDAHSIWGRLPLLFEGELPAVNLGTSDGASCLQALSDIVATVFAGSPYGYVVNGRFKGGYITRHYGSPERNVHAVQIELNQRTYLADDSRTQWDQPKADVLSVTLRAVCQTLMRSAARTYAL